MISSSTTASLSTEVLGFADEPIASHSARFGLARPMGTSPGWHTASTIGVRPWNLRGVQEMAGRGTRLGAWRYDPHLQVAVTLDGRRVADVVAADPSAESISHLDGDEGASEDWHHDFHPDHTGDPA